MEPHEILRWAIGVVLVIGLYRYVFSRIPRRHIERLNAIQHTAPCAFSFLNWRGYVLMATMITLGIALRWSGVVSARTLGTTYVLMGTLLLVSAFRFAVAGISYRPN